MFPLICFLSLLALFGTPPLDIVAVRLRPGDELKQALVTAAARHHLAAAYVATCVGSVSSARIRMASATSADDPRAAAAKIKDLSGNFEIVSLVGTLSADGAHLHVSLSDDNGAVIGGHLVSATVFTTAEVVIHFIRGVEFRRTHDPATGYGELVITKRRSPFKCIWGGLGFGKGRL
mmetsp:Transcript_59861/g.135425  ORF Transcript_59861/g.135425 Transcript_59861/m.135425 type:complete len:177 (-) Transcript_59861:116-646(-)